MTGAASPPPIPAREAYRLWASDYDRETVVSAIDERAVARLSPSPADRILLDAGCGTGRRLWSAAPTASRAVGVDLVPAMLLAGRDEIPDRDDGSARPTLAAGDLRALPIRSGVFDLVWCRLAVGHVAELDTVYAELGRVSGGRAALVLTDFHPAAHAAGHARTFRDADGALHAIVHFVHSEADHRRAAAAAGWTLTAVHHFGPGIEERPFYERAGRLDDYRVHRDLPLVLALCLTR